MVLGSLRKAGEEVCPRSILKSAVDLAKNEFDLTILCGFEFEFVLLKNFPAEIKPLTEHSYSESHAVYSTGTIIDRMCTALMTQGIEVCMSHPEACKGQFESKIEFLYYLLLSFAINNRNFRNLFDYS